MLRSWIFLINPFNVATAGSYRKMNQIGDYTLAALTAYTPRCADLLNSIKPVTE